MNRIISETARSNLLEVDLAAQGIKDYGQLSRRGFALGNPVTPLQLYVDGEHLTRARYPNKGDGYMQIHSIVDAGPVLGDGDFNTRGGTFVSSDPRPELWADVTNAWVNGVISRDWSWTFNRIADYTPGNRRITMAEGEVYGIRTDSNFFFVENVLEEIDQPGEYFLDPSTGMLYLWPPEGFDEAEISVSILADPMLILTNTEYVTFRGIRFFVSRHRAINATGNHLRFEACEISGFGHSGANLTGSDIVVDSCNIHNIGGQIIRLEGGDWDTLTPSSNLIHNNHFHDWGEWVRVYNPAVSLRGVGNIVRHNRFNDFPHNAIEIRENDHLIEYNLFHDGMTDFQDLGVIYGNQGMNPHHRGTVIRRNFFRDVASSLPKQNAIYPDNSTMDWTIEENVFLRVGNVEGSYGAISGNGPSYMRLRNNVFVDCANTFDVSFYLNTWGANQLPAYQARWEEVMSIYNNFTDMPHGQKYPGLPLLLEEDRILPDSNTFKRNLIWNPTVSRWYSTTHSTRGGDLSLIQAQDNLIAGSNPGFVDWENGDLSLRDDASVFLAIPDFVAPPFHKMGLRDAVGIPAAAEVLSTEPAAALQATSAELNGVWRRKWGTTFEIEVFWGRTDGGTHPAAWEHNAPLGLLNNGEIPSFSHSVTGLDAGTTYYYTFRATNTLETVWAEESGSLATLGVSGVDTAGGPTAVAADSAVLRGRLTVGGAATAWICWGPTDGGLQSTENWDQVISIGTVQAGEEFSAVVEGLSNESSYWYRCYVANEYGKAWSEAEVFNAEAEQQAGGWTPMALAPYAWYDASDTNTLWADVAATTPATAAVARWDDKSGNNRHATRDDPNRQPRTGVRTIGGLNVVDCDGNDSMLSSGFSLDCTNLSVFVVRQWDNISGTSSRSFNLIHSQTIYSINERTRNCGSLVLGVNNPDNERVPTGTSLAPGLVSYVKSGTNSQKAWLDGHSLGENVNTVQNFPINLIYPVAEQNGAAAELIVINGALSDADRKKVEGYLAHKWGLEASLPSTHPYKSQAPHGGMIVPRPPSDITSNSATLCGELNVLQTHALVTVYWGETDGGANAENWDHSAVLGEWTDTTDTVTHQVDSLFKDTTYAYTFRAENDEADNWAQPSWFFTTSPALVTENYAVPHMWLTRVDPHWNDDFESMVYQDLDGDGFLLWQEYWSRTDPLDPESHFKIDSITFDGTTITLQWEHAHGDPAFPPIIIEGSTDLQEWSELGSKTPVEGTNTWSLPVSGRQFYRISVQIPE
ncbi:MAG: right-handed parallel beta-helix repeat-containing protein [Kiritimatiellae bacterium]|nr:right-handed parallel beta-helix repeat-containing protein [Kiritimatiellia bacterium]